jgi:hypothetical protein
LLRRWVFTVECAIVDGYQLRILMTKCLPEEQASCHSHCSNMSRKSRASSSDISCWYYAMTWNWRSKEISRIGRSLGDRGRGEETDSDAWQRRSGEGRSATSWLSIPIFDKKWYLLLALGTTSWILYTHRMCLQLTPSLCSHVQLWARKSHCSLSFATVDRDGSPLKRNPFFRLPSASSRPMSTISPHFSFVVSS